MIDPTRFRFHHLGVACRDIRPEFEGWARLGYVAEAPDFHDPLQMVRGRFVVGAGPRLELLEPAGPNSPIEGVLARGGKIYHQGFEALDFDDGCARFEAGGLRMIVPPKPAVAFAGRRVAFFSSPTLNLIELIEAFE